MVASILTISLVLGAALGVAPAALSAGSSPLVARELDGKAHVTDTATFKSRAASGE